MAHVTGEQQIATGLTAERIAEDFVMWRDEADPVVSVIMGSDSDLPIMLSTTKTLDDLEVPYEVGFVSAHRTSEVMHYFGHTAVSRGIQVIIAAAGGSAHLPGDVASITRLPVLGVAIESTPDPLNAAFGSMLRMPPDGGPTATVGKNEGSAINAALIAARILALHDPVLATRIEDRMAAKATEVLGKNKKLAETSPKAYVEAQRINKIRAELKTEMERDALKAEMLQGEQ